MKLVTNSLLIALFLFFNIKGIDAKPFVREVDVCVYGATAAGVIAAYSAKQLGKSVLVIEPSNHIGGMTTGGLGYTDIGNKYAITGLSRLFYRRVGEHYNKLEQWSFPPSIAQKVINSYIDDAKIEMKLGYQIANCQMKQRRIDKVLFETIDKSESFVVNAKQYIDCSYEGDLMAGSKVSYFIGREDNSLFDETLNGAQIFDKHQFPNGIDPYIVAGDTTSGFCWGITTAKDIQKGMGDRSIQAYNYRLCLTNDSLNRRSFEQPVNYDASQFELLLRYANKKQLTIDDVLLINRDMPDRKYDVNNNGPFSTDMIGMNFDYPSASHIDRLRIADQHAQYIKGFLYFLSSDTRVPPSLQNQIKQWGWAKDEFVGNDNFPPQLYVRESRRLHGEYVMTQHNCQGEEVVGDGIAMAAYGMDSHNCRRIIVAGMVKNEGDVQYHGFAPYPISYRSIVPKQNECVNLLVPVCMSATHIAYGSIRMEPVFMVLAQSAALAASMAIDAKIPVQKIDIKELRKRLKDDPYLDGSIPEILVDDTNIDKIKSSYNWFKRFGEHYKTSFMFSWAPANECYYSFLPTIKHSGKYALYFYCTYMNQDEMSDKFSFDIENREGIAQCSINPKRHSGDWAYLGSFYFDNQQTNTITLNGSRSIRPLAADALLLIPIKE